jgi:ketosteroid isomerase-like protein
MLVFGTADPSGRDTWRAMSQENVELVRSMFAAWERGDFGSVEWAHPYIEYVIADGLSPGSWSGLAGMAEGERQFLSGWEDYRAVADEYRELDDERVLVLAHVTGRGKFSGLEIEKIARQAAVLVHIRDGKVTQLVLYHDPNRALSNLGLAVEKDQRE